MATSKQRFKRVVDEVQEAAGKASVKFDEAVSKAQDTASELAKDVRQQGRELDDRLDAWADENASAVSDRLGTDPDKTSSGMKAVVWIAVAIMFAVIVSWLVSLS